MRRSEAPLNGLRYLGDENSTVVHDLDHEDEGCKIDEVIAAGRARSFKFLSYAIMVGYDTCPKCLEPRGCQG